MGYKICRMEFETAVHFGEKNLTDARIGFEAGRLFAALCCEAATESAERVEKLVNMGREGRLLLSDAFIYMGKRYYLPKPMCEVKKEKQGDAVLKKQFKKLKYVPIDQWAAYLQGDLEPGKVLEEMKGLGEVQIRALASSIDPERRERGEMLPYEVGTYRFARGNGLYFILYAADAAVFAEVDRWMKQLCYSGIGGKRSIGLGRFGYEWCEMPQEWEEKLGGGARNVCLSTAMAKDEELEEALAGARYLLVRRGGYIASESYADGYRKKRDFYAFAAGSYFERQFVGDIYEVGGKGGHKVYQYAKPLFMEV